MTQILSMPQLLTDPQRLNFMALDLDVCQSRDGPLPVTFNCIMVQSGTVVEEIAYVLDWARAPELYPRSRHRRLRVTTHGCRKLTGRNISAEGCDPQSVLPDVAALLREATATGWRTVLHTFDPALRALENAMRGWVGKRLPELVITSTAFLEIALSRGLFPGLNESEREFRTRVNGSTDQIPVLAECLTAYGLDPRVKPWEPLWAAHGVRVLFEHQMAALSTSRSASQGGGVS